MAAAFFFLFCIGVVLFGLGFVALTLRHHWLKDKAKAKTPSAPLDFTP